MPPVKASSVRFIRLGPACRWAKAAIANGEIPFDYRETPHELALCGDEAKLKAHFMAQGEKSKDALQSAREVLGFYGAPDDELWVTFHAGRLWWSFSDTQVEWIGPSDRDYGVRIRRARGGWCCTSVSGAELRLDELSSALTKVRRYRRTTCSAPNGIVSLINAEVTPAAAAVDAAKAELCSAVGALIVKLDERDFEVFVELAIQRLGWRREGFLGGLQEEVDFVVRRPLTGERAGVQVKSRATAKLVRDCIAQMSARGYERVILACHTLLGVPEANANAMVLNLPALSDIALKADLVDWVRARVR